MTNDKNVKVGDKIIITLPWMASGLYNTGSILIANEISTNGVRVCFGDPQFYNNYYIDNSEFELYEEDKTMFVDKNENVPEGMMPFDIEKAKAGATVVTRGGSAVRIVAYDRKHHTFPVCAFVTISDEHESMESFTVEGLYQASGRDSSYDLFLKKQTRTVYVNLYRTGYDEYEGSEWDTKELAIEYQIFGIVAVALPIEIEDN